MPKEKLSQKQSEEKWLVAFGDVVSDARESLNMTQQELADLSNVNRTYISDIERGLRNITLTTARRLAAAMEMEPAKLLAETDRRVKSASFHRKVV